MERVEEDIITMIFTEFLDERKKQVQAEVNELVLEERIDESNAMKAKANIYDIAKSVYNVSNEKTAFVATFGKITGQWCASLEKAKSHNDVHKIMIEEAKLSAVNEIKEKAEELL